MIEIFKSKFSIFQIWHKFVIILYIFVNLDCKWPGLNSGLLEILTLSNLASANNSELKISAEVLGLTGKGLAIRLELSDGNQEFLEISQNGIFQFQANFRRGDSYRITVQSQPITPIQECIVTGGEGTFQNSDIQNTIIRCEKSNVKIPEFSPSPGSYANPQSVTLTSQTSVASIYYTLDGSDPICEVSTIYSNSIFIDYGQTVEIRAIACFEDEFSFINFGVYAIDLGTLTSPVFSITPGAYISAQLIGIEYTGSEMGVDIYYKDDGTNPDCSGFNGTLYTTPFNLSNSATVVAISCKSGFTDSATAVANYEIGETVASPMVDYPSGTYFNDLELDFSTITSNASIYYSVNGLDPDCSGGFSEFTGTPVLINTTNTVVKAIACRSGYLDSPQMTPVTYTFNVSPLQMNPTSGIYQTVQNLTITTNTNTAVIRYSDDGVTVPDCLGSGNLYTASIPLNLNTTTTIRAIGCKSGYNDANVAPTNYTITGKVPSPSIAETGVDEILIGPIGPDPQLLLQVICYTLDNSNPSCSTLTSGTCGATSTQSLGAFSLTFTTTVKAVSCSNNWTQSDISSLPIVRPLSVGTPSFSVSQGTYNDSFAVSITSVDADTVRYTLNGTPPACPSTGILYQPGITPDIPITESPTQIQAIGCRPTYNDSQISLINYILKSANVVITPASSGVYSNTPVEVTMTSSTPSSNIYFADDGSSPTCGGPNIYTSPINLASNTIKNYNAIACRTDFETSDNTLVDLNVTGTLPSPNINFSGILLIKTVTISTTGTPPSQTICYRNGATNPSCSQSANGAPSSTGGFCASGSIAYGGTFTAATGTVVRAITCKENWNQSPAANATAGL
ncbi:chitobiase/beta-hexosaminidase C-terminal domain-containing protein [Leptospira sp. GIMC2001]|uniref:chitobiase/beta-hexosaminidase C-terminal domain-containing protein n=1 Tax=Leptospira sp. GIMC2001 TaxID=1513297 RepID=UPI00234A412F|nr:chitobiase/beta-hexosaminidase C-terminal domain-containing protein [Leptospira sp. GIMC2001]WCL49780.1 chitobiase/beta-hexosaminidase C-terminal domain-containing protein [Leptospira sp. GIMC2001]